MYDNVNLVRGVAGIISLLLRVCLLWSDEVLTDITRNGNYHSQPISLWLQRDLAVKDPVVNASSTRFYLGDGWPVPIQTIKGSARSLKFGCLVKNTICFERKLKL